MGFFVCLFLEIIALGVFCIIFWTKNGYIYFSLGNFEKTINIEKIKEKNAGTKKIVCRKCGAVVNKKGDLCENCRMKELKNFSNSSEFEGTLKENRKEGTNFRKRF